MKVIKTTCAVRFFKSNHEEDHPFPPAPLCQLVPVLPRLPIKPIQLLAGLPLPPPDFDELKPGGGPREPLADHKSAADDFGIGGVESDQAFAFEPPFPLKIFKK